VSVRASLDWLNFLLADVRGGFIPYIGVFLVTQANWDPATLGVVLTLSGLIGITAHAPMGAFIDSTRCKRGLLIAGVALLAVCAIAIERAPTLPVVLAADIVMAVAGAIFAPTVAAITLGLYGRAQFAAHVGRNLVFDRIGNIAVAILAGAVGWWLSQRALFYLVPVFAALTVAAVLSIPARAIDHERARGLDARGAQTPAAWRALLRHKKLLALAAGAALFHFANAPMLLLLGQKLGLAHVGHATLLMAATIMIAQIVMIPTAALVGSQADRWGRKPFFLAACAVLALRGACLALTDDYAWLIAVQVLDGIGSGIFEALLPLMVADVMRGSGRTNAARGLVGTIQGIGGSLSASAAGFVVVLAGYNAAFLAAASVGVAAFVLALGVLPETGEPAPSAAEPADAAVPAAAAT
jgi:MFS family permease